MGEVKIVVEGRILLGVPSFRMARFGCCMVVYLYMQRQLGSQVCETFQVSIAEPHLFGVTEADMCGTQQKFTG